MINVMIINIIVTIAATKGPMNKSTLSECGHPKIVEYYFYSDWAFERFCLVWGKEGLNGLINQQPL